MHSLSRLQSEGNSILWIHDNLHEGVNRISDSFGRNMRLNKGGKIDQLVNSVTQEMYFVGDFLFFSFSFPYIIRTRPKLGFWILSSFQFKQSHKFAVSWCSVNNDNSFGYFKRRVRLRLVPARSRPASTIVSATCSLWPLCLSLPAVTDRDWGAPVMFAELICTLCDTWNCHWLQSCEALNGST